MKRFCLILILIFFSFIGCSKSKDKSNAVDALLGRLLIRNQLASGSSTTPSAIASELPTSLAVPVPRSIRKSSSSTRTTRKARLLQTRTFDETQLEDYYTSGYSGQIDLQSGGDYVAEILQESKRDLILLSSAYAKAKATPGVCIPGGSGTVTVTQSMLDEMVDGLENLGLSNAEAKTELSSLQDEGVLPTLGQVVPSPAMLYKASTNPDYDVEISYSFSDSIASPVVCPTNNKYQKLMKFKTDFSKIFSSSRKSLKSFGTTIDITASITNFSGTGKKDKTVLNFRRVLSSGKASKTITKTKFILEQCDADAANNSGNCVTLGYRNEDNYSGTKYTTTVEGRTDDDGGYIRTGYLDPDANEYYFYEEAFNASRELDYYSMYFFDLADDSNDDNGEVGDFSNYDKYYETTYRFEDQVILKINSGGVLGTGSFTGYDEFVIYPTGVDPNNDSIGEYQLGEGLYVDEDDDAVILIADDDTSEVYIDFYGELSDFNAGLQVWRVTYDTDSNPVYTSINTTLKKI
ncbi:hypothetical protein EHQ58_03935 [Leptospira ognonensis]|uniref:Lipoprotein n=1 Tax=Leptospira ognonensis TaxID=2484945 RepID=A0A4R9K695_9LEPT|nr:hypothetical protein [Leptospira ognonensis]TGL61775.1 hypothetical protein EHQ58_03935 [Leptospira ognonensis]